MYLQILQNWTSNIDCTAAMILAQQADVDIVENFLNTWNNLLETGQLWAFLIGIGVGWWIRSVLP